MRFKALATDYDGTIAHHGLVDPATVDALCRLKESGRKLLLVTGRELPDLSKVFSEVQMFHRIVAENGALIYDPENGDQRLLADPPPPAQRTPGPPAWQRRRPCGRRSRRQRRRSRRPPAQAERSPTE